MESSIQPWLDCAKQILAITRSSETYGYDKYDLVGYKQLDDSVHQVFSIL
ncbi:NUDIX hydrolase N-terminal domain-containing protein [Vibrio sp. ES.051]|nr:NUDIX hydrolase N-terminal domain-containing protein [Vibrio sp. ES.051]